MYQSADIFPTHHLLQIAYSIHIEHDDRKPVLFTHTGSSQVPLPLSYALALRRQFFSVFHCFDSFSLTVQFYRLISLDKFISSQLWRGYMTIVKI